MIIRSPEPEVKNFVDRDHVKTSFEEWSRPGRRGNTSPMPTYCRLGFWERATMEIPGARLGTRRTQLRVPSVEDPYVLLAIQYMSISMFTGCRRRRSYVVYLLASLLSGALAGFIYATSIGFYKSPSRLLLRITLLGLLHIGPSRAMYTNNGGIPMSPAISQEH